MARFYHEDPSPAESGTQKDYPIVFNGTTSEYFGIWIVNIALTILTLGIYAPWAKVRREQYLLSHTSLANSTFDYTADPWKILKGRLIVFAAIVVYTFLAKMSPILGGIIAALFFVLTPWAITQSLKFKSRYITYRNIPFGFSGTLSGTFNNFIFLKLFGYITFGLLAPWAKFREKRYLVENLRYGKTYFKFNKGSMDFYKVYMIAFVMVAPLACIGTLIALTAIRLAEQRSNDMQNTGPVILGAAIIFSIFVLSRLIKILMVKTVWNNVGVGNFTFKFNPTFIGLLLLSVTNLILTVITLGLASPYCTIRTRRYLMNNLRLNGTESIESFTSHTQAELNALGEQAAELYDVDVDIGF